MSDPVTNADIEDVLAQVRRLVLQEGPRETSRDAQPAPRPIPLHPPRAPARLVLTPAQRVGEDAEGEAEAPGAPGAPVLVLSPALSGGGARAGEARGIEDAVEDAGRETWAWEPDGSEEPDWTPGWTLGGGAEDGAEAAPPVFRHRSRAAAPAAAPPVAEPPAASRARDARSDPGLQPDARMAPAPVVEALDEDRLRALVTEVVREVVRAELQGELGERVTRNLRKLVRREVFRVLDGRDEA